MNSQYEAVQLQFVGDAQDVVLGSLGVGNDIGGEVLVCHMEFESDHQDPND